MRNVSAHFQLLVVGLALLMLFMPGAPLLISATTPTPSLPPLSTPSPIGGALIAQDFALASLNVR
ncbi:MAG: hypothetical protein SNJ58_13705, partial [Aggregatilineales bacterium]